MSKAKKPAPKVETPVATVGRGKKIVDSKTNRATLSMKYSQARIERQNLITKISKDMKQ